MLSPEETMLQRTQVMGRSLLTLLSQIFRNAEIYKPNNQIFAKILKNLGHHINESFRAFNACAIRVSHHNAYIADHRIYIDSGMVESVHFLADLFETAEIDGISIHAECQDLTTLFRTLLSFREIVIKEGAKGPAAIHKALADKHQAFIETFPISRDQTLLTGLRTKVQAEQLAFKSALKLMLFLQEMDKTLKEQRPIQTSLLFRILLNLIRINQNYPHCVNALLFLRPPAPRTAINYYSCILLLVLFKRIGLERQTQLDLIVDFLFHNYGELSLPVAMPNQTGGDISQRGTRKLLEQSFVNRAFFYRLIFAHHTPLGADRPKSIPLIDFMKMVKEFLYLWKIQTSEALTAPKCLHRLLRAHTGPIEQRALMLIGQCMDITPIGSLHILDAETPVIITDVKSGKGHWHFGLETIPQPGKTLSDRYRWELKDDMEKTAYMKRLTLPSPRQAGPNPTMTLFKRRAY